MNWRAAGVPLNVERIYGGKFFLKLRVFIEIKFYIVIIISILLNYFKIVQKTMGGSMAVKRRCAAQKNRR
jgi:hypothetical protein